MDPPFYHVPLFFAVVTAVFVVRFLVYYSKLLTYLRQEHPQEYERLATTYGFGTGCPKNIKAIRFLFTKDHLDDPQVLRLKVRARNSLLFTLQGIATVSVTFIWALIRARQN